MWDGKSTVISKQVSDFITELARLLMCYLLAMTKTMRVKIDRQCFIFVVSTSTNVSWVGVDMMTEIERNEGSSSLDFP